MFRHILLWYRILFLILRNSHEIPFMVDMQFSRFLKILSILCSSNLSLRLSKFFIAMSWKRMLVVLMLIDVICYQCVVSIKTMFLFSTCSIQYTNWIWLITTKSDHYKTKTVHIIPNGGIYLLSIIQTHPYIFDSRQ